MKKLILDILLYEFRNLEKIKKNFIYISKCKN